jgi:diguanylate cyclase (GGDEF)-like protein
MYCRITGVPRYLPDGSYAGYRGTGNDVTELELRNQELVAANMRLDHQATELRFMNDMLEHQREELTRVAEAAEVARHELEAEVEERRQLEQRLRELAMTDALTGAANRRAFFDAAEREFVRARRHRLKFAMVAIDIDHFKRINDSYGHAGGDEALRAVAAACLEQIRASDYFGRIGGEEFVALLTETDAKAAFALAERLRQAIADLRVAYGEKTINLTASFGVATQDPADTETSMMMSRADAALYRAKEEGRNRVVFDGGVAPLTAVR